LRQRTGWLARRDQLDEDVKRLDAVIVHLSRAAAAADGDATAMLTRSGGRFATCSLCGSKRGRPSDPEHRCKKCLAALAAPVPA
jgi:hypothetical protein